MNLADLDLFLEQTTREAAKLSATQERQAALGLSADYASRLQDRATFRRLLASDQLDATRFRFWFSRPFNLEQYDLDGWRERIDRQIMKEPK